jgi:prephenate dehydratase
MIVSIVILWYYHSFMGKRVAYQGILGSFSSMAARAVCGPDCVPIHTRRFREIFEHVVSGDADIGIVPIENALAGSVHENFDLLGEFKCSIVAEYYCPVQLHLLALPNADSELSSFTQAISHPKALEQCSEFLEHHSNLVPTSYSDTAGAALQVRETGDCSIAAIASEEAADTYGLTIIARNIQNHALNSTRFFAVSATEAPCSSPTKASLLLTLPHEPGSLYRLLGEIAGTRLNVTKIESRPIVGKPFEYAFHLVMECMPGHSSVLRECVSRVQGACASCRVLGCYAAATEQHGA